MVYANEIVVCISSSRRIEIQPKNIFFKIHVHLSSLTLVTVSKCFLSLFCIGGQAYELRVRLWAHLYQDGFGLLLVCFIIENPKSVYFPTLEVKVRYTLYNKYFTVSVVCGLFPVPCKQYLIKTQPFKC